MKADECTWSHGEFSRYVSQIRLKVPHRSPTAPYLLLLLLLLLLPSMPVTPLLAAFFGKVVTRRWRDFAWCLGPLSQHTSVANSLNQSCKNDVGENIEGSVSATTGVCRRVNLEKILRLVRFLSLSLSLSLLVWLRSERKRKRKRSGGWRRESSPSALCSKSGRLAASGKGRRVNERGRWDNLRSFNCEIEKVTNSHRPLALA